MKVPKGVLPIVVIVSCAVEADVPLNVTEVGDTEQIGFAGVPRQLDPTV